MKDTLYQQDLLTAANVMADCFTSDPLNSTLLKGLSKADKLMKAHSILNINHAAKLKKLYFPKETNKAFCIWTDSQNESRIGNFLFMVKIYWKTFQVLGLKDILKILENNRKINKILSFSWQKEFLKGRFYRLKIIAVDKSLRGTGIFRKLINPLLNEAEEKSLPIVLETHNLQNVPIYEKFGFKLVKTITHPDTDICQYCMIREPAINLSHKT